MSNDDKTFTECKVVYPAGTEYVFAITVKYNTQTGEILRVDYEPVLTTG